MSIRQIGYHKPAQGPARAAAQHPYILLLLLFYLVAGTAAGLSSAQATQAQAQGGELARFFSALPQEAYHIFPAILHSAALNLLLYCLAYLPRLWPPLLVAGGLPVALKGLFMGISLHFLYIEMGLKGLGWGVPLCLMPALFCVAAFATRILADARGRAGEPDGGLSLRSYGFLALCVLLESAAAPLALRAWLK